MNTRKARMVADIGGTHTRVAVFDPDQGFRNLQKFVNREHASLQAVFESWLSSLEGEAPDSACIAIAAPQPAGEIRMTNMPWTIQCASVEAALGLRQCRWLNDFEANAFAIASLEPEQLMQLQGRPATGSRLRLAALGPGTGLGGSICEIEGTRISVWAAEPGQAGISPGSAQEIRMVDSLLDRGVSSVCNEWLVSGPGLSRIDSLLRDAAEDPGRTPEQIVQLALDKSDAAAAEAVDTFLGLLGSVCGDFVTCAGTWDGVYLFGGLLGAMTPLIPASPLLSRLAAKGCLTDTLSQLPVSLVTAEYPGLVGAAHAPLEGY